MKKTNISQLDDKNYGNIEDDYKYIHTENNDGQNIDLELLKEYKDNKNLDLSISENVDSKLNKKDETYNYENENKEVLSKSRNNIDNKITFETDNNEFINADILINEEIDNYGCDNCIIMDNNIIYLSNKVKNLYLDVLKNYDNILDGTYYVNNNLEEAINIQNVKNKNIKIDLYNILQNKRKLNIDDINSIKNILEEEYEIPHITQLFRNKIVDPIIEELRFIKNEFNNFIELIT